jgi:hypothetical protein
MSNLAKDIARGYGRALVIRVIATAIGLPLGCIYVFAPLWLLFTFDFQIWALAVAAVLWLGPMLVGGVVFPAGVVLQRKAKLDGLFVPLGLTGRAYQTRFRQYHGDVQGRQVDVYFQRGPVLEIEVNTTLQTHLGITDRQSDTQFFASLMGRHPLVFDDPALGDLTVFAADEAWARSLLAIPDAVELLLRLTSSGSSVFTRQQVILRPGTLGLTLSGNRRLFRLDLSPQQVRAWLDDLVHLVQAAERLPAPQVTAELTSAEQSILKLRQRNPYLALWVGLGFVLFFLIAAVVILAAVFLFASLTGRL